MKPRRWTPRLARWIPAVAVVGLVVCAFFLMFILPMIEVDSHVLPSSTADVLDDPKVRQAAEGGDPAAQFRLGKALFEAFAQDPKRSIDKNSPTQAIHWLETAARGGNSDAMVYLGRLLRAGVDILQDFNQAFSWIHAAARLGNPEGMLELARLYRDGVGTEKDPIKAYAWFNRSAAAHNADAVRERDTIAQTMSAETLREAQMQSVRMARETAAGR